MLRRMAHPMLHRGQPRWSFVAPRTQNQLKRKFFTAKAEPSVLYQAQTPYNLVQVIEIPEDASSPDLVPLAGSRIMLLDQSGNIHSMWRKRPQATHSYWDFQATLPALSSQQGTMGILGLGAGTLARMVAVWYPAHKMVGWELDPAVLMAGRMFMGMDELESSGRLVAHTGDALAPEACIPGGFSSIAVDIFSEGQLPDVMTQVKTWEAIKAKLASKDPMARVMVNLGRPCMQADKALQAMQHVFGEGHLSVCNTRNLDGQHDANQNCVAVTGCPKALAFAWESAVLPRELQYLKQQYSWSPALQ